jgi:hypothetical protein
MFRLVCLAVLGAGCLHAPAAGFAQEAGKPFRTPVESELIFEGSSSFGHFHIFANSWWSELYVGGVEYDRHSWDYFLKARMDYVAEVLPVAILRQPVLTDVWGVPQSPARERVPGLAISPIGLRMMWRSKQRIKPYLIAKGGMIGFDKKALAQQAAYENFLLQIGIGLQARLTKRVDARVGFADVHFSDAFVVPSNPGLDSMTVNGGLSYHFGK